MERLRAERASEVPPSKMKSAPKAKQTPKAASTMKPVGNADSPKGNKPSTSDTPIDFTGFINRDYIPVNVPLLTHQIDGLIARFRQAVI